MLSWPRDPRELDADDNTPFTVLASDIQGSSGLACGFTPSPECSLDQSFELPFAVRMAAAVVVTVPLLVGVLIVQRRIIAGLTAGVVKG